MSRKILLLKTPEEQDRTKPLYREIFPEDTEEFLDFYYRERPKRILAMEEDGEIIAMLHLNPFLFSFFGKEITASYIYAVATKKEKRRQGIMGELLHYSLLPVFPMLFGRITRPRAQRLSMTSFTAMLLWKIRNWTIWCSLSRTASRPITLRMLWTTI